MNKNINFKKTNKNGISILKLLKKLDPINYDKRR